MKRFLVRLYPAGWRARYGDEFEALLEERPLGPFDVADIALAAIDAHIRPRGAAAAGDHTRGVLMTLRIGGVAAIVGGVLWLISLAGASIIQGPDGQPWQAMFVDENNLIWDRDRYHDVWMVHNPYRAQNVGTFTYTFDP